LIFNKINFQSSNLFPFHKLYLQHHKLLVNYQLYFDRYDYNDPEIKDKKVIIGVALEHIYVPCLPDGVYNYIPFNQDIVKLFSLMTKELEQDVKLYAGRTVWG
jgi:hypothetical protein